MIYALVTHDFSVKYVADVGSRETPLYYTVISLWAALEGSILFWGFILAGYTVVFLAIHGRTSVAARYAPIMPFAIGVLLTVSAFFLVVMSGPGNPFVYVPHPAADGPGPNPLLQNHPLWDCIRPSSISATLGFPSPSPCHRRTAGGRYEAGMLTLARKWALVSWCFLTLGIIAGMWWSYDVLGWGGYWSWDPVENAVLMPWLVTTAFLHSLQVQERRHMLKTWTISLVICAFLLSIMGTFLTRSGILASVHAFTQSSIGPVFLGFLAFTLLVSLGLLLWRSTQMAVPGSIDAVASREAAFLVNNVLLVTLTFTILLGTLFPLLAEALSGQQLSVGGPYFDRVAIPIAAALLFLMGVGPILPWGASKLEETLRRLLIPAAFAVGVLIVLVAAGVRGAPPLLAFGLCAFVLAATAESLLGDVRSRQRNTGEPFLAALSGLINANPRRYGGYVAHVGLLFVIVGIASSQAYSGSAVKTLLPGQSAKLDGYRFTLAAVQARPQPNRMVLRAAINVSQGGSTLAALYPSVNYYPTAAQPIITPGGTRRRSP